MIRDTTAEASVVITRVSDRRSGVIPWIEAGNRPGTTVDTLGIVRPFALVSVARSPHSVARSVRVIRAPVVVVHTTIGGFVIVNEDGEVLGVRVR